MKMRLGLISLATGTLLLAAVTACDDAVEPPPSTAPSVSPSSTPPTASSSNPSEAASADATDAVHRYYAVLDEIRTDPKAGLGALSSVAVGSQLKAVQTLIERQQAQGRRQTGTTAIGQVTVQSTSLDNSDPTAGAVPTVVLDVCWDVTDVDLVDATGKSVLSPDRPDTGATRYTVANYAYSEDPADGWRVASGRDLDEATCAAS